MKTMHAQLGHERTQTQQNKSIIDTAYKCNNICNSLAKRLCQSKGIMHRTESQGTLNACEVRRHERMDISSKEYVHMGRNLFSTCTHRKSKM